MAVKTKSRSEKIGAGLGLVIGIIGANLMVPLFFEMKAEPDMGQMIVVMVGALLCSELGARIGKWLDARTQPTP